MRRRSFLAGASAGAAWLASGIRAEGAASRPGAFRLDYAPHFGMFRALAGEDLGDQLRFMADEGFRSVEDNGLGGRPPEEQRRIGAELERLEMRMGVFVAHADFGRVTFASDDPAAREAIVADMRRAVELAERVNARWCTVVPGALAPRVDLGYQTANVIDNLRRAAEVCEPAGLVMVLEPLNRRDHPGLFLTGIPHAFLLCRAVASPSCKILDDLYHQQITEGDLIPNLDRAWDEIAYLQVGDNPGRKEPGTGEIHYANVFRHLAGKGFEGIIGMEHGNSRPGPEGERAVIEAYRSVDPA